MDYEEYRARNFAEPMPEPRFRFAGCGGVALYIERFDAAVLYYTDVLGWPAYSEGDDTVGWPIGAGWLTLLRGRRGGPSNVELVVEMATPAGAEALQRALIAAGGEGPPPTDQLMYVPVRSCPVRDPFGTDLLIVSPLAR
jgi:hypothetical protein